MKLLITLLLSMVSTVLFAQADVDQLKQKVDTLFEQEKPLEALAIMEELVHRKDTIPGYARYKTKIGLTYYSLDSLTLARKWFKDVMYDTLIADSVEDYWLGKWEVCGNYKHISCYNTAVSYYKEGDYNRSIQYYKLSIDSFPYYHFSGSDFNKNKVRIYRNIADLYAQQGDLTQAFSYLMPFFEGHVIYSDRAVDKAAKILKDNDLHIPFLMVMKKDYKALIQDGKIALVLSDQRLLLDDMEGKGASEANLNASAKHYWQLLQKSDIIESLNRKE